MNAPATALHFDREAPIGEHLPSAFRVLDLARAASLLVEQLPDASPAAAALATVLEVLVDAAKAHAAALDAAELLAALDPEAVAREGV